MFDFLVHEHRWIKQLKPSLDVHFFNLSAMISSICTENAVYKVLTFLKTVLISSVIIQKIQILKSEVYFILIFI